LDENFFLGKGNWMGDKGKKDKGRREEQKKAQHTKKEKRQEKKDKLKSMWENEK